MSTTFLRPLLRSPPLARAFQARSFVSQSARVLTPTTATPASRKTLVAAAPGKQVKPEPAASQKLPSRVVLLAGMPQLVPFYFVNEVATTFGILTVLIYLYSKYWLPQTVRTRLARLFVVKL